MPVPNINKPPRFYGRKATWSRVKGQGFYEDAADRASCPLAVKHGCLMSSQRPVQLCYVHTGAKHSSRQFQTVAMCWKKATPDESTLSATRFLDIPCETEPNTTRAMTFKPHDHVYRFIAFTGFLN